MSENTSDAQNSEHISIFEKIKKRAKNGADYWTARSLARVLEYTDYRNFLKVVEKARLACVNSGIDEDDHFVEFTQMVDIGSGAKRQVRNYYLSRYACYLIIENSDPAKPPVALGQTYFAEQTQRMEQVDKLDELTENQKRIYLRNQLSDHNKQLASTASKAGVIKALDFAIFQDHGYAGLYGGLKAKDIRARKHLKKSQEISDYMSSEELAANLFRATQTEAKLRREKIKGKEAANQVHYEMGQKVREFIKEVGGTMPEDLPTPKDSIKQLERAEEQEQKNLGRPHQLSLFDSENNTEDGNSSK